MDSLVRRNSNTARVMTENCSGFSRSNKIRTSLRKGCQHRHCGGCAWHKGGIRPKSLCISRHALGTRSGLNPIPAKRRRATVAGSSTDAVQDWTDYADLTGEEVVFDSWPHPPRDHGRNCVSFKAAIPAGRIGRSRFRPAICTNPPACHRTLRQVSKHRSPKFSNTCPAKAVCCTRGRRWARNDWQYFSWIDMESQPATRSIPGKS